MKDIMNIELIGEVTENHIEHCGIQAGVLRIDDCWGFVGTLLAVGENEEFLHCFVIETGSYLGVYKSDDKNHLYQHLLNLNACDKSPTPKPLLSALRQYQHNDCSGLLDGFDHYETIKVFIQADKAQMDRIEKMLIKLIGNK